MQAIMRFNSNSLYGVNHYVLEGMLLTKSVLSVS